MRSNNKLNRILAVILMLLFGSTAAYAYSGPKLRSQVLSYTTRLKQTESVESSTIKPVQKSVVENRQAPNSSAPKDPVDKPLKQILREKGLTSNIPNLKIVVDKSDHLLTLYSGSTYLKSYKVALGEKGLGAKEKAGDRKTPEGTFYVAESSVLSPSDQYLGSRWMRLSYPNVEDADRGLRTGLVDQATYQEIVRANKNKEVPPQRTALGGGVGIHGGDENGTNTGDAWTWGCVALTNPEVNEIFDYIQVASEVYIKY